MKKIGFLVLILLLSGCKRESTIENVKQIYVPGTYQEVGQGEYGDMEVEVELSETEIVKISILSSKDTNAILNDVKDEYIPDVIALQNINIDATSGATGSCNGVKEAVSKILEEHQYEEEVK